MKPHTWTPDERDEYDRVCAEARDAGTTTSERVDRFIELIREVEGSNAMWVRDLIAEIWRVGAAAIFKRWLKSRNRPIAITHDGHLLTKPVIVGRRVRREDGSMVNEQTMFDFFSWDDLRAKVREYRSQMRAYTVNMHMAERLLELEDAAPGASTPADALAQLGMSMQEWFDAEASRAS